MIDFPTRFSCLIDVGTTANAMRAFDIYSALMADNARNDPPAEPFLLSLTPEHGPTRLWLRDSGSADQQPAITFVTRCAETFGLTGRWGFQWANIASNPVVDGFSGGAHVLDFATGQTVGWISTGRWLAVGNAHCGVTFGTAATPLGRYRREKIARRPKATPPAIATETNAILQPGT